MRFFVAGNLWLLSALLMLLGREYWRGSYHLYSFFGIGGPLYPIVYNLATILAAVLGVWFIRRSFLCSA